MTDRIHPQEHVDWLRAELNYERAPGLHTVSPCAECGKMCRGVRCADCLQRELTKLTGRKD